MNRNEIDTICAIADRGIKFLSDNGITAKKLDVMMDIEYAHEDVPMDLDQFLAFDNGNFNHDFVGIRKHMDRIGLKLGGCFVPRCALRE